MAWDSKKTDSGTGSFISSLDSVLSVMVRLVLQGSIIMSGFMLFESRSNLSITISYNSCLTGFQCNQQTHTEISSDCYQFHHYCYKQTLKNIHNIYISSWMYLWNYTFMYIYGYFVRSNEKRKKGVFSSKSNNLRNLWMKTWNIQNQC